MDGNQDNIDNSAENLADTSGKNNKHIVEKSKKKAKRHKQKIGFYYSFLTFVLLFCLVQVGFGVKDVHGFTERLE